MTEDKPSGELDTSTGAIAKRIVEVSDDLFHGRTTAPQRQRLGQELERANRVRPGTDKAFKHILGA